MPRGISFDRVAGVYDASRSLPPTIATTVADLLARVVGSERTLEVGVGTARWALPLQWRGVRIVGVDLAAEMLRVGRTKGFERPVRASVRRLPFRDRAFDGALSTHLLHLVHDVPGALREIARVEAGMLRSVLEHDTERPDLSTAYKAAVAREGVRPDPPGVGERTLAQLLVPDRVRDAATFQARVPASARVADLRARSFQHTWAAPDEVHARVVDALEREFGDQEVTSSTKVEIVEWSSARLMGFAAAMDRASEDARASSGPAS